MPLPSPILDDRSFDQLSEELRRRIPVYTPEWTDHNESDPGVTLLELFAHLGEALLYRFNQIPESTKLAFLRLLHLPLRPAVAAQTMVALTTKKPDGVLVPLRSEALAGKVGFELETEVYVFPVTTFAIAKAVALPPADGDSEMRAVVQRSLDARGGLARNEVGAHFSVTPLTEDPATPGATGVDFAATVDDILWIPIFGEIAGGAAVVVKAIAGKVLNIGIIPHEQVLSMAEVDPCPGAGGAAAPPSVVWQMSAGLTNRRVPRYLELVPVSDTTRGLTQTGIVRLRLPRDEQDFAPLKTADLDDPDREGTDDLPPPIEDEDQAKKVLFWLRAFRPDGGALRRLVWVGANASIAVQHRTADAEFLGTGTAQAGQQGQLVNGSVVPGSARVDVEEIGGWTPWREAVDFQASGEDDRVFTLDADAGVVTFGNGVQGRAPQIGERIRVSEYRYGGGAAGNAPAGAVNKIDLEDVKITNVVPARGGQDPEALEAALERIPSEFRRHDRAVAATDFRELALASPGAEVGRAEVLPLFHPRMSGADVPGVVSVVVWPREDARQPDAPMPDRTLLSSVCRWLDTRRLVTTELYVIPPTYRKVAISVGLEVKPGHGVEAVRRWVELVIRQYLAPLPPFGPSGQGWPLGRRVHGPEIESAALQVEGVEFLHGLNLASLETTTGWTAATTVVLAPYEVPQLAEITITQGPPLPAGQAIVPPPRRPKRPDGTPPPPDGTPPPPGDTPPPPGDTRIAIPVPLPTPREKC